MQLEEIYENQLFAKNKDAFDEKLWKLNEALDAPSVKIAFIAAKLALDQKQQTNPDFYKHKAKQLDELESQYFDFLEKFGAMFTDHPSYNHPNQNSRKDIYG